MAELAYGAVRWNSGDHTTILAVLSPAGIQATLTLDGTVTGNAVAVFVRDLLCPTLVPGQIEILDTLSVHKQESARLSIEAVGQSLLGQDKLASTHT